MRGASGQVVVAGGGVMGWSTALFLKRLGYAGRVVVVERGGEDYSSTSRSAGGIRHQFTNEENVRMSMYGTEYLRSLVGTPLDVQYKECGYLYLAGSDEGEQVLRESNLVQKKCGANVSLLSRQAIQERWPYLFTEDLVLGAYGEQGEGWLDPALLRCALKTQAMSMGVELHKAVVSRVHFGDSGVVSVELEDATKLNCDALVNAMGPSCADLDPSFSLPVKRRKRTIFYLECKEEMLNFPMVINNDGIYVRPEGCGYISGGAESDLVEADAEPGDFEPCDDLFDEIIWPSLAQRVPAFECVKVKSSWAGHYEYNTLDQNAIIGKREAKKRDERRDSRVKTQQSRLESQDSRLKSQRSRVETQESTVETQESRLETQQSTVKRVIRFRFSHYSLPSPLGASPTASNMYLINGFSGHGLQQSPAAGRGLAELMLTGSFHSIDLTRMSYERIARKEPLFEKNII